MGVPVLEDSCVVTGMGGRWLLHPLCTGWVPWGIPAAAVPLPRWGGGRCCLGSSHPKYPWQLIIRCWD